MLSRTTFISVPACLSMTISAWGQIRAPDSPQAKPPLPHHESPQDEYVPAPDLSTAPPASFPRGVPSPGSQVNVNGTGFNIVGDAANEPSLCIDPTRAYRIAIGWRQFDTVASNFRQAGWAYSRNSGRTWTFPGKLTPGTFRSDPVLRADANGDFYYCSLQSSFAVDFFKSADGGRTWGLPSPAFGGDKQWFTIDTTGSPGRGHIYMYWSEFASNTGLDVFTRSTNAATSFSTPQPLPNGHVFGTLDVGPDGELYMVGFDAATLDSFWVTKSINASNAGQAVVFNQSTPVDLGGSIGFGDPNLNPAGLLGQATVVVNRASGPRRGHVYVLATVDPPGPDGADVRFSRSTDGGATFSPSIRLNADAPTTNAYQWFGTMAIAPNGRIDVVWNDTRNAPNPSLPTRTELYYRFSNDGGITWSPEAALAPPWNPTLGFPQQNKIGDYYDMLSDNVGANLAYAATYNGEQDVWFLRIGDYDCNGNGVGDTTDLSNGTSSDANNNDIPDECECIGDVNADELVDLADLTTLLGAFGSCTGQPAFVAAADIDRNGCVTLADLTVLLSAFGSDCR